jgi:hypothetical protein
MKDKKKNNTVPNVKDNLTAFVDEVSSVVGSVGTRLPIAGVMPLSVHIDFALSCARKIMCFSGDGCGTCPACRACSFLEPPGNLLGLRIVGRFGKNFH